MLPFIWIHIILLREYILCYSIIVFIAFFIKTFEKIGKLEWKEWEYALFYYILLAWFTFVILGMGRSLFDLLK